MSKKPRRRSQKPAVAYFRTSSATNAGPNKDSLKRQRDAVHQYAKNSKLEVVREFDDPAVSGADPIQDRPGFGELLSYITGNGARIVLVENASRFARDLAVQIAGHETSRNVPAISARTRGNMLGLITGTSHRSVDALRGVIRLTGFPETAYTTTFRVDLSSEQPASLGRSRMRTFIAANPVYPDRTWADCRRLYPRIDTEPVMTISCRGRIRHA